MVIKQEVAYGIIEAITDLRKGDDLKDFIVIVDGISVRCHKFILGACSLFFRALFRSEMKENKENCATLEAVSHSTFTLILTALYTGCDILSDENVLDVWRATHMLEIGFLVKECENFVEQNISIENFEEIYKIAKLLNSKAVLRTEHNFMAQNFDLIRKSQTFSNLPFDEINELIEADELVTSSEDRVVESVLQWISYVSPTMYEQENDNQVKHDDNEPAIQDEDKGQERQHSTAERSKEESLNIIHDHEDQGQDKRDNENDNSHETSHEGRSGKENVLQDTENQNRLQDTMTSTGEMANQTLAPIDKETQTAVSGADERQQHLLSLISNCRSCLLSPEYLRKLLSNPIIVDNPALRSIMLRAMYYQLETGQRHGQWPSAAIHRNNSHMKNVLIWTGGQLTIHAGAYFSENFRYELTTSAFEYNSNLTAFDNELYEIRGNCLYVFRKDNWYQINQTRFPSQYTSMIPLGKYIYFLDRSTGKLMSVNPKMESPTMQEHPAFPGGFYVTRAVKYQDNILVFSLTGNGQDEKETDVHTFDTSNETWERLDNLKGPAENIISFNNDENTFLLQTNGNLWKVTDEGDGMIKMTFCMKAWDFHWELYGAAIFREKLVIVGGYVPEGKDVSFSLPDSGEKAHVVQERYVMCVTPITLPLEYLKKND